MYLVFFFTYFIWYLLILSDLIGVVLCCWGLKNGTTLVVFISSFVMIANYIVVYCFCPLVFFTIYKVHQVIYYLISFCSFVIWSLCGFIYLCIVYEACVIFFMFDFLFCYDFYIILFFSNVNLYILSMFLFKLSLIWKDSFSCSMSLFCFLLFCIFVCNKLIRLLLI